MPFLLQTDNSALILLAIAGSIALLLFINWVYENARIAKLYKQRKPMLDNLEEREKQIKVEQARREELLKKVFDEREQSIALNQNIRESKLKNEYEEKEPSLAWREEALKKQFEEQERVIELRQKYREQDIKYDKARHGEILEKRFEEKERQLKSELEEKEKQLDARLRQETLNMSFRNREKMDAWEEKVTKEYEQFKKYKEEWEKRNKEEREALELLAKEKTKGFPWLADAYADYYYLKDMKVAKNLERKSHPAHSSAEKVREIAALRKEAERRSRIMNYQMKFYENLFPWIVDLKEEEFEEGLFQKGNDLSGLIEDDNDDPARKWLTPEEYSKLPNPEKYQTAIDRYWTRKKSKWEIGRDFERFVGWQYESQGATVYYQGIIEGFDDLGRDLIVKKVGEVEIVQCKYWAKEKTIHEKHVFQLYGTMTAYEIDHPFENVRGRFVTSTLLSDRARKFAEFLKIQVDESQKLDKYPCIKCNIAQRDGEKIYHLPFDQQYDKTVIEPQRGEFFAWTVAEAEEKGFRRAWRYRGEKK